jgi:hypothetical protein
MRPIGSQNPFRDDGVDETKQSLPTLLRWHPGNNHIPFTSHSSVLCEAVMVGDGREG